MSPLTIGLLIFVVTVALLATGLPIAFGLGAVALAFMVFFDGWNSVGFVPETIFAGLADFTLVSLPMFVIMGAAVASSRAGSDLYEALARWLHRVPGSLVISNIGACALFSALTGSSPATCAAIGKMGIPEMRKRGYDADLATGAIAAGGTLGILIPPSITMILYGIASETSIGRLFLAGIIPGLLLVVLFMAWALFLSWKRGTKLVDHDRVYSMKEKLELLPKLLPFMAVIVGVVYALYGGIATPSEAAGVGAALCLLMVIVIYRVWSPKDLWAILRDGLRESGMLLMIIGTSILFGYMMSSLQVTQSVAEAIGEHAGQSLGGAGRDQPDAAGGRLLPAAGGHHPDDDADPDAGHHRRRLRPDLVRRHPDDQHGTRPDHAAGGPEPVRHQRHHARRQPADHPEGGLSLHDVPWCWRS